MQVVHALTGVLPGIGDDPVTAAIQAFIARHLRSKCEQAPACLPPRP